MINNLHLIEGEIIGYQGGAYTVMAISPSEEDEQQERGKKFTHVIAVLPKDSDEPSVEPVWLTPKEVAKENPERIINLKRKID